MRENSIMQSKIASYNDEYTQIRKLFCSAPQNSFKNAIPIPGITDFYLIEFTDNGYLRTKTNDSNFTEIFNTYSEL